MDLIIETDIGRDADDFFALCYLAAAGVNIRAITVSPGDKDQIAVAKFLLDRIGLVGVPVGSAKPDREKSSVGGVHVHVLKKYGWPERMQPDGRGEDVMKAAFGLYPDAELFCIGPLQSVGPYLRNNADARIKRATMQGGFAGYHLYEPPFHRLPKFEGLETCPTFNLGGDKKSAQHFVATDQIAEKRFVGKNVCHTIVYEPKTLEQHKVCVDWNARNHPAESLFLEAMQMFFDRGAPHKMFHDPTAAACMLHQEIGTWIDGEVYYEAGKWGTRVYESLDGTDGPHRVLVDIDREKLWHHIWSGT